LNGAQWDQSQNQAELYHMLSITSGVLALGGLISGWWWLYSSDSASSTPKIQVSPAGVSASFRY
jgi:hypothetical protein